MSSSATPDRDAHLLEVGKQCSASGCLLVDFLPFKCQHCTQPYCGEHFLPTAHACAKYDAAKLDRVAPSCPLCNTPVAIPPGQDPNIRMERHINSECSVMTGRRAKPGAPTCARPKCGKVLFSPIRCESCKQQYCPQHRFPKDHTCSTTTVSTPKQFPAGNAWTNVSKQTSAASAAAMAAMKRAAVSTNKPSTAPRTQPTTTAQTSAKATASSSKPNPFSATERRARAERESRRKAIQERTKKGILPTEEEKAFLAASSDKDDCLIILAWHFGLNELPPCDSTPESAPKKNSPRITVKCAWVLLQRMCLCLEPNLLPAAMERCHCAPKVMSHRRH